HEPNEQAAEAAYAAVLSLEQAGKQAEADQRQVWSRRTLAAASRLASEFPQHPQAVPALIHGAQQAFELDDHEAAAAAARQLLDMPGLSAETRLTGLRILGHTAFDQGHYLVAEAAYAEALSLNGLSEDEQRQIGDRLVSSIYRQGEQHRQSRDTAGAAAVLL